MRAPNTPQPLLYLSYYFKAHRAQYYDRLMAVRNDGDWEGWIKFFLKGVFEVSQGATETARAILDLREEHRGAIAARLSGSTSGLRLLDYLFQQPIISVGMAQRFLGCAYVTASTLIDEFQKLGILFETTGRAAQSTISLPALLGIVRATGSSESIPHQLGPENDQSEKTAKKSEET